MRVTDRLTAQDLMNLWSDDLGWPMEIGALAISDGSRLLEADLRFRPEGVREVITRHLPRTPRLRQVLYTPRWGLGGPLWFDAPGFDLARAVTSRCILSTPTPHHDMPAKTDRRVGGRYVAVSLVHLVD